MTSGHQSTGRYHIARSVPAARSIPVPRSVRGRGGRALAAAVAVGIAGLLAGCAVPSGGDSATSGSQPVRYDGEWVLTDVEGVPDDVPGIGEVGDPDDGQPVTLLIDGTAVSGSGGCNGYSAELAGSPGSFEIGSVGQTQIACADAGVQALEDFYFESLTSVVSADLVGGQLTLSTDARTVLTFQRSARAPDLGGDTDPASMGG